MINFDHARQLLRRFQGETYLAGFNILSETGRTCRELGSRAVLVSDTFPGARAS
jgi:hypothetical protein